MARDCRKARRERRRKGYVERPDNLYKLTPPISFKGKVAQYAGRLHRQHHTKTDIRIYDYVDQRVSVLAAMYKKRLKTYKSMGYEIQG